MRYPLACILTTLLLLGASCTRNPQEKDERERWTQNDWKQAIAENEERLKREEDRQKGTFAAIEAARKVVWDNIVNIYNFITGDTPFNAAKDLLDPYYPERRRKAVVYLSKREFGREDPYLKYYSEMARTDQDHLVRAMAIRALNRSRDDRVNTIYVQALEDPHPLVRLEAAKALANIPEPASVGPLIKHLSNTEEAADVRVACADALRNHRTSAAAQALVVVLRDRDFAVSWQARKSLRLMTGKDFRYDPAQWLTFLSGNEKPFG